MLWFLIFKRPWNKPKNRDRIYFGRFGSDGRRADIERTLIVMTAALSIEEVSVIFANKIRRWSLEYRGVQCQSRSWKDKLFIRSANTTVSEREVELQFRSEDGVCTSTVWSNFNVKQSLIRNWPLLICTNKSTRKNITGYHCEKRV